MIKINYKIMLILGVLLLLSMTSAMAAVNFEAVPSTTTIRVGDTFTIGVLLDIPATENIKKAEFIITPTAGASITMATSGNLLPAPVTSLGNIRSGTGWRFGESTTSTAVSGDNRLFTTLTATATTAGSVTFTFSGLSAAVSAFPSGARTTTSTPLTITIASAAAPATFSCTGAAPSTDASLCTGDNTGLTADTSITLVSACTATKCEYRCDFGVNSDGTACLTEVQAPITFPCTGTIPDHASLCTGDNTGLTASTSITTVNTCTNNDVKCEYQCDPGFSRNSANGNTCVQCGNGIEDPGEACDIGLGVNAADVGVDTCPAGTTGTPTCSADCRSINFGSPSCQAGTSPPPPSPSNSRRQQLITRLNQMSDSDFPATWTPAFISSMARLLRDVYRN